VKTAGPIPLCMEFARLEERLGLPIWVTCEGPLEFVRGICGLDTVCRWMIKKPELVHRLMQLTVDYIIEVVRYWVDTFGPQHILAQTAAPSASNQVISPKYFETFVLPYQKELHEEILDMGIKHIFCHICGEQNLNLPYWVQIPMGNPGIVSFGHEVDLTTAIKYLGDTCIIAGNVEPAIIQTGTPQQVYELCKQAIEKGKHAPRGFMLMPGCSLPPKAPPYNVFMMKKAINDFGWYD
jgi:uroporphyrinogen decarboxylase